MARISPRQFLENSIFIWFNPNRDDIQQSVGQLQQTTNAVEVFNDEESLINYVVDIAEERILLIVTKDLTEPTIELIRQLPQIDSVYLFGSNEQSNSISNIRKFKGIVHDNESLYQILRSDIRRIEHENVTFNLIGDFSSFSGEQLNRQEAAFMYTQLLKDIFIEMKDDSKDEMTSFCREEYAGNTSALQFINDFEKNYQPNQAINWYTRESFLYKILNKALRTQNISVLYKIRTFIRNLHFHLLECYQEQKNNSITSVVYRGQCMSNNEFEKIRNNKGGLLSVSNFFSTTEDQSLATIYAGISNDDETAMIFEIKIEPSLTDTMSPFANIQEFSNFGQAEKEWLFSFGCVFRIVNITKGTNNQPWYIHLLLTNESDQELKMMTEHFRSDISVGLLLPIHSLGKLSYKMGDYSLAIEYYILALKSEPAWRGKIMILKELGQTYERLALYDNALTCFDKALSMHEELNDKQKNDYHRLAAIYVSLATIHTVKQDKDQSFHYLNEALKTELNIEQPNKENLLNCYNDIGFIHFTEKKYDLSLFNYQEALNIGMKIYPATHPNIGTIYMNIGNVYQAQKRYEDALENSRKSLDIQIASLPVDHPDIARSFNNISSIYHSLGRYDDALTNCKNALQIYLKRMPQNHPNLAILYNNMIELCDKLGQLNESLDYRYKQLDIYLATLQPNDTKIGIAYNTIAATLVVLRRFDEAAEYALKALDFTTRVFGANHSATQTCARNLKEVLDRR
jgi:tetratricopeptide (TPR) repeat protein